MNLLQDLNFCRSEAPGFRVRFTRSYVSKLLAFAIFIAGLAPRVAQAQVQAPGDQGGLILSAGAMGSGYSIQYGQRKMAGITAFVDADTKRRFGIEAEGRWLEYFQTANVHVETYSIGGAVPLRCRPL